MEGGERKPRRGPRACVCASETGRPKEPTFHMKVPIFSTLLLLEERDLGRVWYNFTCWNAPRHNPGSPLAAGPTQALKVGPHACFRF